MLLFLFLLVFLLLLLLFLLVFLLLLFLLLLVFLLLLLLVLFLLFLLLLILLLLLLLLFFLLLLALFFLFLLLLLLLARCLLLLLHHLLLLQLLLFILLLLILLLLILLLLILFLLLILRLLLLLKLLFQLLPLLHQLLILLHELLILRLLARTGARRRCRRWRRQGRQLILLADTAGHRLLLACAIGRGAAIHRGATTQQSEEGDSQNDPAQLTDSPRRRCPYSRRPVRNRSCAIFITGSLNKRHVTQDQHPSLSLFSRSSIRRPGMASAARAPG